jgi:quercetin dioxygenase-like cupin family protein
MQITRNTLETAPGPSDWFTRAVYIDTVATPSEASRLAASSVHFTPGARTAWHIHPNGQTIFVTEGVGLCQRALRRVRKCGHRDQAPASSSTMA